LFSQVFPALPGEIRSYYHSTHMNTTKHLLDLSPRTKLRLSEVQKLIRIHRIVVPPLSRRRLTEMCEDGTLETAPRPRRHSPILVYEDSFLEWIKRMDGR
jgi:hypothetical protein